MFLISLARIDVCENHRKRIHLLSRIYYEIDKYLYAPYYVSFFFFSFMTRINLVPPEELCDQHLLAEHRELTRIPNAVAKGKYHLKGQPAEYKLGEGHVRFFFNKLAFLKKRYDALHAECKARGFNVQYIWNETLPDNPSLWLDYEATEAALQINRERIQERMPLKARFTPHLSKSGQK